NKTASTNGAMSFDPTSVTRGTNTSRLMALIDVNKDGKVDWVRFPDSNTFSFDWGDGSGSFQENNNQATVNTGVGNGFFFQPTDIDGDGEVDFLGYAVSYDAPAGVSRIMHRKSDLSFEDVTAASGIPTGSGYSIIGAEDLDQDGDVDLIV